MTISLVLSLLALGTIPAATAQSPGTFTPTGDMKTPRWVHTATLLTNGKVLTTGGFAGGGATSLPLSSAELYDPAQAMFLRTGYMATGRAFHIATLLGNGKVSIAGGQTTDGSGYAPWPQFSLELYDPSTGAFTPTGSTTDCSSPETATLLANGKVFLAANYYSLMPGRIDMAELYDPSTGEYSPIAKLPANAMLPAATLLMDGNVLVTSDNLDGGPTAGFGFGELYDPICGTFITTKNMTMARKEQTATLLPDGSVLITGGCLCGGPVGIGLASAEIYNLGKGSLAALPTQLL
jgi:hypothetical protein